MSLYKSVDIDQPEQVKQGGFPQGKKIIHDLRDDPEFMKKFKSDGWEKRMKSSIKGESDD